MKKKRTALKTKADVLFSKIIRSIGYCANCGATTNLQCAHIISRSYKNIRWNRKNAVCLCSSCHLFFTYHPVEWEEWVLNKFGQNYYEDLKRLALEYIEIDYEQIIERLKAYGNT